MNKKGLTLVELIAVIAILGILMVMVGPAILSIRETVMQNSLDSKLTMIKTAAIEYGSENIMSVPSIKTSDVSCNTSCIETNGAAGCDCRNLCLVVSVKTLIARGYVAGDNDTKDILTNPFSSEPLNNSDVCIAFDSADAINRKVVTYIFDEDDLLLGE